MRIGFIGLGDQGAPIAQRIATSGYDTVVWARREQALDPFRDGPAKIAASLTELGSGLDLLETCVFDAAATFEVLFGPDGAARSMPPGSVIAVHSTVAPDDIRRVAAQGAELGLHVLDAPVSGGGVKASQGELIAMIGGDAEVLARCRPVFSTFASLIVHLGGVGAGQHAKLLNNAMLTANAAVAADAFAVADRLGLNREGLAEVLRNSSGRSFAVELVAHAGSVEQLARGQARPTLSKDVTLLAQLLADGAPSTVLVPVAQTLIARWDAAVPEEP